MRLIFCRFSRRLGRAGAAGLIVMLFGLGGCQHQHGWWADGAQKPPQTGLQPAPPARRTAPVNATPPAPDTADSAIPPAEQLRPTVDITAAHTVHLPPPDLPESQNSSASATAADAATTMLLPVTLRARNPHQRALRLRASTPCAVFDWWILALADASPAAAEHSSPDSPENLPEKVAADIIQAEPNRLCAQVVVGAQLPAGQRREAAHVLSLEPQRYRPGGRYRLAYTFWGQPGHHDFTVAAPPRP